MTIDYIRKMLSESGEAVGNEEHDYSIIDMIENLIKSKDYFVRKSDSLERERNEARELLRILAGLVAYGLGQSGEEWSLEAMRQATTAIKNAKSLEETK